MTLFRAPSEYLRSDAILVTVGTGSISHHLLNKIDNLVRVLPIKAGVFNFYPMRKDM